MSRQPVIHEIKFKGEHLCDAVYKGIKTFELRKNDRDYRVGDFIKPISIDSNGNKLNHPIDNCLYEITYLITEWQVALKDDYCVFSIKPLKNKE